MPAVPSSGALSMFVLGNHRPTIRGTDDGIWRRVRVIEFPVKLTDVLPTSVRHATRAASQPAEPAVRGAHPGGGGGVLRAAATRA